MAGETGNFSGSGVKYEWIDESDGERVLFAVGKVAHTGTREWDRARDGRSSETSASEGPRPQPIPAQDMHNHPTPPPVRPRMIDSYVAPYAAGSMQPTVTDTYLRYR